MEHAFIPLPDGTRLAGRIWLPEDAETAPVPAILDFLPYRYGDLTVPRDSAVYPYLAARGYACARVDLRGTGNSEGIIKDEYTAEELSDGVEVIAWLAGQPWCDGAVGMTGISWGGFNSLQVAALRPPALKAIITMCASDDRYSDDVHYRGGCVLGIDMLQWAVSMLTWNALPPDPRVAGEGWREAWHRRITETPAFIEPWLTHQSRDEYWRHGSVCEDYSAIEIPVYAVGGWSDGYSDAVLRLLAGLSGPRKGLIGPWSHAYPNSSVPGPRIGYLEEALRWWDHWLKGVANGIMDEPALRVFMQHYTEPASFHPEWPGRFVAEPTWPPQTAADPLVLFADGGTAGLRRSPAGRSELRHRGEEDAGLDAGALTADGGAGDWPADQRAEDGRSLSFSSAPLSEPIEILGTPTVGLEVAADQPVAAVVVRLCDVAPTGESLLVSRGMLNLTRRHGFDHFEPVEPGRFEQVVVPCKAIAHRFEAGHRIRLSVSSTYWPWIWPAAERVELTLACGRTSFIELPVREPRAADAEPAPFGPPEDPPGAPVEVLERRPTRRTITHDLSSGESQLSFDWDVGGHCRLVEDDTEIDGSNVTLYRIKKDAPLSATVVTEQSARLACGPACGPAGDCFDVRVETRGMMTGDAANFLVTLGLDAFEGTSAWRAGSGASSCRDSGTEPGRRPPKRIADQKTTT